MNIIAAGLWVGMILAAWFKTSFLADWCRAIPFLGWVTGVSRYLRAQEMHDEEVRRGGKPVFANVREYIRLRHGRKFFGKLVTCEICLSVWLALPAIYLLGLVCWFPVAAVGLLFYLIVAKLLTR